MGESKPASADHGGRWRVRKRPPVADAPPGNGQAAGENGAPAGNPSARARPGSRLRRLKASHSFGFVLLLVVSAFAFTALAPNEAWARSVLVLIEGGTLIAALWTTGLRQDAATGATMAVAATAIALMQLVTTGPAAEAITWLVQAVFIVGTCLAIGVGVADQGEVNGQSVVGAVSIYLSVGMFFTFVYSAAALLGPGSFFTQGTDGTPSVRLYFSYVTLATLGYGDYTPAHNAGRTLAIIEALIGQLYLVTVIAVLVSNLGRGRAERP